MHATRNPTPRLGQSAAQLLRDAADYLHQHGWCQDDFYGDDDSTLTPPADVMGALAIVCFGYPTTDLYFDDSLGEFTGAEITFLTAMTILATFIGIDDMVNGLGERADYSLAEWNDEQYQSVGCVIAVMRAAADDFDATGGAA